MKCPHDKILIHFSQERINDIFFTTVVKNDGTVSRLEISTPAEDIDDRASTLFAEIGEVIGVGSEIKHIIVGDTAILDYNLFNDVRKLISEDQSGRTYIVDPVTKYHKEENIAYSEQDNERNQLVWNMGEVEEMSQLLAIVRDGELIANDPFVFLKYEEKEEVNDCGTLGYVYSPEVVTRKVLSISSIGTRKYDVKNGDSVLVREPDTFTVKINDKLVSCCNDEDLLIINEPL